MRGSSSLEIFLSYRHEEAATHARLLQEALHNRLPRAQVFIDKDFIKPGTDFSVAIRSKIRSCTVLVALIGSKWATLTDEEGHRRLDNPNDWVRFEVQAALERGVRVIPVLVNDAELPQ